MIRLVTLLAAYAAVVVLGGCTGSIEDPNPILIVTGYQDRTGAKVALIRDNFGTSEAERARLEFIPESVRELPAPARSYDVVDRAGSRSTLVVLSRGSPQGGAATGYLTFFSLTGIDLVDPSAFEETGRLTIDASVELPPNTEVTPRFCPSRVQVTQNGAFAAVLNEPRLCGSSNQPSIGLGL